MERPPLGAWPSRILEQEMMSILDLVKNRGNISTDEVLNFDQTGPTPPMII